MELTEQQRTFLHAVHYAIIGTLNPNGTIQQTVVWYMLEDDVVRFSLGSQSIKARNLRQNPNITLTVEDRQRYLTLTGTATIGPADDALRRRLAMRYRGPDGAEEYLTKRPTKDTMAAATVTIKRVYGQGVK